MRMYTCFYTASLIAGPMVGFITGQIPGGSVIFPFAAAIVVITTFLLANRVMEAQRRAVLHLLEVRALEDAANFLESLQHDDAAPQQRDQAHRD